MDREHTPVEINEFNGLWRRGSPRNTPPGYATESFNIKILDDGISPRGGIQPFQNLSNPLGNVIRQYPYILPSGFTTLSLVDTGDIYHVTGPTTVLGPILSIAGMTDFGFVQNGSIAYLSPGYTDSNGHETGMPGQSIYVYKGAGVAARTAGGAAPTNSSTKMFIAANARVTGVPGVVSAGVHVIAVAYRAAGVDGVLGPEIFPIVIAPGTQQIQLQNIPIGPVGTTDRIIVMSRAIDPALYDPASVPTFYEVIRIADNTTENLMINTGDASLTTVYVPGATPAPTTNSFRARQSSTVGYNDRGFRIIGVVYETDTGALTAPGPEFFAGCTTVNTEKAIDILNIPVSPNTYVTKRHLIATKVITLYNGDQTGFQFFFIPSGTINDNVTTTATISWFDSELLEDASYLLYNLSTIPAGIVLGKYKGRLVSIAESGNMSLARVSAPGDFESVSTLDGFILFPPNNKPLTNCQEFRDVLYLFQDTKTIQYVDNDGAPATWEDTVLDNGVGTANHAIATVLDSNGINVDYLLIGHYSGIFIFNGAYSRPELTFAVNDLWTAQSRDNFYRVQIINDSTNKILYCVMTDGQLLVGDYTEGLDPKNIKWTVWGFDFLIRTIHLINVDTLVIGAFEAAP
jgi:hypothetical protein